MKTKVFKKSFFREKLAYQIFTVEDKLNGLLQILQKQKHPQLFTAILEKRRRIFQISLNANKFKSSFYHAGLSS